MVTGSQDSSHSSKGGSMTKVYRYLRFSLIFSIIGLTGCLTSCFELPPVQRDSSIPLRSVENFELDRYLGLWFNISNYDVSFQRGCQNTTAEYNLMSNGRVEVINSCRKGGPGSDFEIAEGVARIRNPERPSELQVRFSRLQRWMDNYWVILLDEDYQWAVVGEPSGRFLWVISRTPELDEELYADILEEIEALGYPTQTLEKTIHDGDWAFKR